MNKLTDPRVDDIEIWAIGLYPFNSNSIICNSLIMQRKHMYLTSDTHLHRHSDCIISDQGTHARI